MDPDATDRSNSPLSGPSVDDQRALEQAVLLASASVRDGGGPFGAVIRRDGKVIATGQNRVTRDHDPTAHAEIVAIRATCVVLSTFALDGCTLYTSCEPCPLCLAASLWARVDRIVFSADRHDAARAGFDDRAFHDQFVRDTSSWERPIVVEHRLRTSTEPFDLWLSNTGRVGY